MESEKLLPCPFCGGEARYEWHSADPCWIECNACGAVGPNDTHTTTEANAAAWNARAPADLRSALEAELKEARSIIAQLHSALPGTFYTAPLHARARAFLDARAALAPTKEPAA